jgi:pSer/pThr/pTyr-binding forkhead associated (FHA) protein
VIVCPRCSKENQDHYKFCLGCGSELPRETPRAASPQTPPSSALAAAQSAAAQAVPAPPPAAEKAPPKEEKSLQFARTQQGESEPPSSPRAAPAVAAPPPIGAPAAAAAHEVNPVGATPAVMQRPAEPATAPAAVAATGPNSCPACGNPVPVDFKFCGTCGHRMPSAGAAKPAPAAPAAAATAQKPMRGSLVVINPDGTEGGVFPLPDGTTSVGRNAGAVFSADAYLSPTHATFSLQATSCSVKDENSLNGVYVKLKRDVPVKLNDGDVFRIGQELIRFEVMGAPRFVQGVEPMGSPNPGYVGRLSLVIGRESVGNGYPIPPDGMHLGRERGDVIFPEDGYVSGLHCRVHYDGSGCVLTDVGSSNGTFLRVRGTRTLTSGDLLLMGQQLFRLQC